MHPNNKTMIEAKELQNLLTVLGKPVEIEF